VRTYKRKRPPQWRDKDKRMVLAARLRGEGMSLRGTAAELGVSYETVRRDLARWDTASGTVIDLSRRRVTSHPPAGRDVTPGRDRPRTTAEALGLPARPRTVREERLDRAAELLSDWR
jgi:hypothetical protein